MRKTGILLHPSSLATFGPCGDIGPEAHQFLSWLQQTGITLWQTLPLHPPGGGFSPYSSPSAFAGAVYLISLDFCIRDGLIDHTELSFICHSARLDEHQVLNWKLPIVYKAAAAYLELHSDRVEHFIQTHHWAEDWALFCALREEHQVTGWQGFPAELRDRDSAALSAAKLKHASAMQLEFAAQALFFEQWAELRSAASDRGIQLVGDMPIFIAADSADAWTHQHLFRWGEGFAPDPLSGAPPDAFTPLGQHWGNPLYDWPVHEQEEFAWWIARLKGELELTDYIRIDHFRGFCQAWEIPLSAAGDARLGEWGDASGKALFTRLKEVLGAELPFVAEDLGVITPDVDELREECGLMGMKVLQFAFGDYRHTYLPHNYQHSNWACYTGTHDNNTSFGWYHESDEETKHRYRMVAGRDGSEPHWDLIRMALSSTAKWAIIPLQDVLGLDHNGRMNIPGQAGGHWSWRMHQVAQHDSDRLRSLIEVYSRLPEQQD